VSPESLAGRRSEWEKVVRTWYQVVDFVTDPANRDEAVRILASRVNLPPGEYAPMLEGTHLLCLAEVLTVMNGGVEAGLASLAGSNAAVDAFNVEYGVYATPQMGARSVDASLAAGLLTEPSVATAN
jgi:NitT/TauT family transport system substrate-binding protein